MKRRGRKQKEGLPFESRGPLPSRQRARSSPSYSPPSSTTMAPFASTSRQRASSTSSDDSMTESGQDPVVKRLPVYYTPHYLNSLTLLQYPDRPPRPDTRHPLLPPSLRPDHDPPPRDPARSTLHAKYKPLTQHLEVKVPIERQRDMYNDDKAKEFAQGVLDDGKDEQGGKKRKKGKQAEDEDERQRREEEKDRRRLDSITYSSASVPDVTNYLVGIVKDGQSASLPLRRAQRSRPALLPHPQTPCTSLPSPRRTNSAHPSPTSTTSLPSNVVASEIKRIRTTTRRATFQTPRSRRRRRKPYRSRSSRMPILRAGERSARWERGRRTAGRAPACLRR